MCSPTTPRKWLYPVRAAGYRLTDLGRALLPVAFELQKVAERFPAGENLGPRGQRCRS